MPKAARIEIESSTHGFYVYRFAADGAFGGDTWHATLDEVKHQVRLEFGLDESDWVGAD